MRRALAGAVIAATALMALAGCGNDATDDPQPEETTASTPTTTPSEEPTEEPSEEPSEDAGDDAIEIKIRGDKITPNGDRVKVQAGETVTLEVESDRAGALHVHSTPEQELEFDAGETTLELTVETPGVVDVEEHEAGVVVLQLEVR